MAAHDRVFDSWAVMAFLADEPPAPVVEQMIADAQKSASALLITTINVGEIWYNTARAKSSHEADRIIAQLRRFGFEFVSVDWQLARAAANFKVTGKAAYADCFAAALAQLRKIPVVTGDLEFKQFEGSIKIHWLK